MSFTLMDASLCIYFVHAYLRRLMLAGKQAGLLPNFHGEEFSYLGSAENGRRNRSAGCFTS